MATNEKQRTWSSKSLASSFAHNIFYWAIRFGGRYIAYFMLIFVVAFYTVQPAIRNRSSEYRLRRFGQRSFLGELCDCFKLQMELGKMLVDRAVMGILGEFTMDATDQDKQTLTDLAAQGQGMVLVTGHVGCWQLGMSVLDLIDGPIAVVMYTDENDVDRHYYEHGDKQGPPFSIIDPRGPMGGTLEMMEIIKKGGVLCVMGDRNFGSPKGMVDVEFMGGTISVPISAYKIASTMNVPIAVTFSHRTGAGHGRIWISRVIDVPEELGRRTDNYQPYAQQFAQGLEEFVAKHPYQFFNFFNMWDHKNQ
ncbi:MAG: lysophospholipid acyltransferase family protein [Pseudodesulfovibrio sp.]